MHVGLGVCGVREIERFVNYARYLEKTASALWGRVLSAVSSLGRARVEGYEVSREKVELLFWVHKAFLAGFLAAITLMSVLK